MSNNISNLKEIIEEELKFSFPSSTKIEKLDEKGKRIPKGLSLVDLLIEEEDKIFLVEIKDPFGDNVPNAKKEEEKKNYIEKQTVISEKLVPKIRDSYTFLHLMERDKKDLIYIVFLDFNKYEEQIDKNLIAVFNENLSFNIKKESDTAWKKEYLKSNIILSIKLWNDMFDSKNWKVERISQKQNTSGANA